MTTTFGFVARFEKLPVFRKISYAPARSGVVAAFIIILSMTISLAGLSNIIKYGYGYCGYSVGVYKNRRYLKEHPEAESRCRSEAAAAREDREDALPEGQPQHV